MITERSSSGPRKVLSVFSLVMINVIAVDSLRTLPISAQYGTALIFFYVIGALLFFIPIALIAAELATGWPQTGGVYVWVREAFGKRWGVVAIWLQWIYNVVWYPTILSFLAATIAYLINPELVNNKVYLLSVILGMFWGSTILNCLGMRVSSWVSTIGAVVGTIIPMLFIIILGVVWLGQGHASEISFHPSAFWPTSGNMANIAFFTAVLFGLIGMEMSAVHAEEVKNPQRDYPRALLYSTLIIFFTLVLSSLAIAIVVPQQQLNLVSGLIDAFGIFFTNFHMTWMIPVIAVLIIIGGLSGVSTWVIGPTKGLMIAARDSGLPAMFHAVNSRHAPVRLLMLQGLIFTLLCTVFLLMPTVNSAYWLLSALTAQLAVMVYLLMFAAGIKLRYKFPEQHRAYRIPGNNMMMWLIAGIGFLTCVATIGIGFLPPADIKIGSLASYETKLIVGIIIFSCAPLLIFVGRKLKKNKV